MPNVEMIVTFDEAEIKNILIEKVRASLKDCTGLPAKIEFTYQYFRGSTPIQNMPKEIESGDRLSVTAVARFGKATTNAKGN